MFTVGDIGYLDADGYLYLCDRKSDMIISGGVNIYPAEIEAELSCHPAVADVAVFGIPHEEWGEEIKAVVQPADGRQPGPDLTAELLAFLAAASPASSCRAPSTTSPNCRATPTASSTSAASATRTGQAAPAKSKPGEVQLRRATFREGIPGPAGRRAARYPPRPHRGGAERPVTRPTRTAVALSRPLPASPAPAERFS